jgi:uncharacterized membrane protein
MSIIIGNMTNLFGGIATPNAIGVTFIDSENLNKEVKRLILIAIYVGISVFVTSYLGLVCWILTGERISRRIRM